MVVGLNKGPMVFLEFKNIKQPKIINNGHNG